MPTISREAIQEVRDYIVELEERDASKDERIAELEEEVQTLRVTMDRWVADRSTDV